MADLVDDAVFERCVQHFLDVRGVTDAVADGVCDEHQLEMDRTYAEQDVKDVLDALGLEQVGWRWLEPRSVAGWYFATERPVWVPAGPPEPVYRLARENADG